MRHTERNLMFFLNMKASTSGRVQLEQKKVSYVGMYSETQSDKYQELCSLCCTVINFISNNEYTHVFTWFLTNHIT